jgi:hypothetical protein
MYELLFLVPNAGFVASQNPERQQLYLGQTVVMKRAPSTKQRCGWRCHPRMALTLAAPTIYVARFLLALTRAQLATQSASRAQPRKKESCSSRLMERFPDG